MLEIIEVGKVCSMHVPHMIMIAVYVRRKKSNLCVGVVFAASIMNKKKGF